jgi:YVTN family beta-propeller protein
MPVGGGARPVPITKHQGGFMSTPALIAAAVAGFALSALIGAERAAADTAYVANEATSTISVIDTTTNSIVTTICLGSDPAIPGTPQPAGPCNGESQHHNPFYNGHVDPHGLWLTPDGSVLLVAARISGTIVAIDTATHTVLGYTPVGREPHLATVHPRGLEAWVAVRGESHIDVLKLDRDDLFDAGRRRTDRMEIVETIDTMRGPSMVSFTSDGRFAFVAAGKQARVDKIDARSRRIVASQAVPAPFTPFGLVTPDDQELYLVHKGAGTLSILNTSDLGFLTTALPVGARANHVFFVGNLAYITIGGAAPSPGNPDPEGSIAIVDRTTQTIVNRLTGPAFTGDPHGIWASSEGKLFVTHERGNRVSVIRTNDPNNAFDDVIEGTVTGSAMDLAFMKRLIDIVIRP